MMVYIIYNFQLADYFGFERTLYTVNEVDPEVEVCVTSRGPNIQETVTVQMITIEGSAQSMLDITLV